MSIDRCVRSAAKPECISAATERARARRPTSAGHRLPPAYCSLTYSQMAIESHTASAPSIRQGTRPLGV